MALSLTTEEGSVSSDESVERDGSRPRDEREFNSNVDIEVVRDDGEDAIPLRRSELRRRVREMVHRGVFFLTDKDNPARIRHQCSRPRLLTSFRSMQHLLLNLMCLRGYTPDFILERFVDLDAEFLFPCRLCEDDLLEMATTYLVARATGSVTPIHPHLVRIEYILTGCELDNED